MRKTLSIFILSTPLMLAACSGNDVKHTLGLNTQAPDEFMVMTHPPLSVPEKFELPQPGDVPPDLTGNPIANEAEQALFRNSGGKPAAVSKGESALLSKADAEEVDPDIRRKLYAERQEAVQNRLEQEESTFGALNPWTQNAKDPVLDSTAEQKRVEEALKEGKPVTSDGVKEKERKPKAPLEGIFN